MAYAHENLYVGYIAQRIYFVEGKFMSRGFVILLTNI
jgi:hypothetical protein